MGYKKQMMKLFNSGGAATPPPSSQNQTPSGGAHAVPHQRRQHPWTSEEAAVAASRSCPVATTSSNGSDSMGRQDSLDPLLARGWLRSMPNLSSFDAESLHAATNGFANENVLGEGGFGRVYRGKLADGRLVAVKRLDRRGLQGDEEFMTEVSTLNNLRHPNIIRLHGVCVEDKHRMCVFQLGESSLRRRLDGDCPGLPPLTWPERILVLLGVARGLVYLHEGTTPQIVHSDVTSNNVLLLKDGSSSLADFGLARDLPKGSVTLSEVRSAFGYISPELAAKGTLSPKADSFSFGVLVLEVLTGLHPIDTSRPKGQHDLVEWLRPMLHDPTSIGALLDPRLPGGRGASPLPQLSAVCEVASGCLRADPDARLQMSDALDLLRPASKAAPQPAVAPPAVFSAPPAAPCSSSSTGGPRAPFPSPSAAPTPPATATTAPRAAAAPCTPQRSPPPPPADLIAGFSSPVAPAMPAPQSGWNPFSPPPPAPSSSAAPPPPPQEQQSSRKPFADEAASGGQQHWWRSAPNPFLAPCPGAAACQVPMKAAAPYSYTGGGAAHRPAPPVPGRDPFAMLQQPPLPFDRAQQQQQQLQQQQKQLQRQQQQFRPPQAPPAAAAPPPPAPSTSAAAAAASAAAPPSKQRQLDSLCVVCMSSKRDHKLAPCGHAATCSSCAMVLSAVSGPCPVCSTPVATTARISSSSSRSSHQLPQQAQQQPQQGTAVLNYSQGSYNPYVAGVC